MFGGDNEFGNILQQAVKLKSAQMEQKRTTYEKRPYFVQHTLFHGEKDDFKAWRLLPFEEKLEVAERIKDEGNALHSERNFVDAVDKYEESASVFYYYYSTDPGWRKNNRGIDDDVLVLVDDQGSSPDEAARVNKLRLTCCLNLSACKMKLSKFDEAITACNIALELDPLNVKALYRRAEARVKPGKSTAYDQDLAISDLEKAMKGEPDNATVRSLLTRLREERRKQKDKDKRQFTGMFDRGQIYSKLGADNPQLQAVQDRLDGMSENDSLEKRTADAEMLRDLYMQNGKEEEAKALNLQIQQAKKALRDQNSGRTGMDFSNPTEEMIADAKAHDIDLTDPMVQEELRRLEREGLTKDGKFREEDDEDDIENLAAQAQAQAPKVPWMRYFVLFGIVGLCWRLADLGLIGQVWKFLISTRRTLDEDAADFVEDGSDLGLLARTYRGIASGLGVGASDDGEL